MVTDGQYRVQLGLMKQILSRLDEPWTAATSLGCTAPRLKRPALRLILSLARPLLLPTSDRSLENRTPPCRKPSELLRPAAPRSSAGRTSRSVSPARARRASGTPPSAS